MDIKEIIKEAFKLVLFEEYEGYKNYPTYVAANKVVEDPADIQHWIEQAQDIIENNINSRPSSDPQISKALAVAELASLMKQYYVEAPDHDGLDGKMIEFIDWRQIADQFMHDEIIKDKLDQMFSPSDMEEIPMSLNESVIQEMDLGKISGMPADAIYIMASIKSPGSDDKFAIIVVPRELMIFFQDLIKFINSIQNERGKYTFVKYITNHKDPKLKPQPSFMQIIRAVKIETHELNPLHEPKGDSNPQVTNSVTTTLSK